MRTILSICCYTHGFFNRTTLVIFYVYCPKWRSRSTQGTHVIMSGPADVGQPYFTGYRDTSKIKKRHQPQIAVKWYLINTTKSYRSIEAILFLMCCQACLPNALGYFVTGSYFAMLIPSGSLMYLTAHWMSSAACVHILHTMWCHICHVHVKDFCDMMEHTNID